MSSANCGNNETSEETVEEVGLIDAIDVAIKAMTVQLKAPQSNAKGSITDLVRLLQLRKELEGDRPRQVSARWVNDECRNLKTFND